MDRKSIDACIVLKNKRSSISLMEITVDDCNSDAFLPLLDSPYRNRHIIDIAKPLRVVGKSVMESSR